MGSFNPNGYGLYDMTGNVWEFVSDLYQSYYYGSQSTWHNPPGPSITGSSRRVIRGGSWNNISGIPHIYSRYRVDPMIRTDEDGFRCVQSGAPG